MAEQYEPEEGKRKILMACLPIIEKLPGLAMVNPERLALSIKALHNTLNRILTERIPLQLRKADPGLKKNLFKQLEAVRQAHEALHEDPPDSETARKAVLTAIAISNDILKKAERREAA